MDDKRANSREPALSEETQGVRKPAGVDHHVAHALKVRRRQLGVTQQELADRLGVTFQQVQKYERGGNRISAGRLFAMAQVLGVPVGYFFEGLGLAQSDDLSGLDLVNVNEGELDRDRIKTFLKDYLKCDEAGRVALGEFAHLLASYRSFGGMR